MLYWCCDYGVDWELFIHAKTINLYESETLVEYTYIFNLCGFFTPKNVRYVSNCRLLPVHQPGNLDALLNLFEDSINVMWKILVFWCWDVLSFKAQGFLPWNVLAHLDICFFIGMLGSVVVFCFLNVEYEMYNSLY